MCLVVFTCRKFTFEGKVRIVECAYYVVHVSRASFRHTRDSRVQKRSAEAENEVARGNALKLTDKARCAPWPFRESSSTHGERERAEAGSIRRIGGSRAAIDAIPIVEIRGTGVARACARATLILIIRAGRHVIDDKSIWRFTTRRESGDRQKRAEAQVTSVTGRFIGEKDSE